MQIFFVTPEAAPFSKAGALGDLSYHLPANLKKFATEVNVIIPKHLSSEQKKISLEENLQIDINYAFNNKKAKIYKNNNSQEHNTYLIEDEQLFNRQGIYGTEFGHYEDNAERFIFFNRVTLKLINKLANINKKIIIHCHDWVTGLIPLYLKIWQNKYPNLKNAIVIFTYHNLKHQGLFEDHDYHLTELDWNLYSHEALEFHGKFNFTKAGLLWADAITSTSQTYINESLKHEVALGLEGVIEKKLNTIYPILNGVDYENWSPKTDKIIKKQYSIENLNGKLNCRDKLIKLFGFKNEDFPILAISNKINKQKGYDIICQALTEILKLPINICIMGYGDHYYQNFIFNLTKQYTGKISLKASKDPIIFRYLLSGADMFLMTPIIEPNAVKHLYAMQYGTIPIIKNTGNLNDTVIDASENPTKCSGYKFYQHNHTDLTDVVKKSSQDFNNKKKWQNIIANSMAASFTWETTAQEYITLYKKTYKEKEMR